MPKNLLNLDTDDFEIFKSIIKNIKYPMYAFGSRVKNTHQKFSDIDLCIASEISDEEMTNLKEKFENSNLSVKVDLKKLNDFSPEFLKLIQNDFVCIK